MTRPWRALHAGGSGLILGAVLCLEAAALTDSVPTKVLQVPRTASPPVIDGRLDDEIWVHAAMVSDLHQMDPIEYSEASERSEFYVAYDKDALRCRAAVRRCGGQGQYPQAGRQHQ